VLVFWSPGETGNGEVAGEVVAFTEVRLAAGRGAGSRGRDVAASVLSVELSMSVSADVLM